MACEKHLPGLLGTQEIPSDTQQHCDRKPEQKSFPPNPSAACNVSSLVMGSCHALTFYKFAGLQPHIQTQLTLLNVLLYLDIPASFPWDMVHCPTGHDSLSAAIRINLSASRGHKAETCSFSNPHHNL